MVSRGTPLRVGCPTQANYPFGQLEIDKGLDRRHDNAGLTLSHVFQNTKSPVRGDENTPLFDQLTRGNRSYRVT